MKIRMLKDDHSGGFRKGDVFDATSYWFIDNDGDRRVYTTKYYEVIPDNTPQPHPQEAYNVTPDTKYLMFVFERSWPHTCIADAERQAKTFVRNGIPVSDIKVKPVGEAVDLNLTFGLED